MLAHILLGKSLIQSQQADKAKAVLEKALELAEEQNHDDPKNEILGLLEGFKALIHMPLTQKYLNWNEALIPR